jgi:hypothetical protein
LYSGANNLDSHDVLHTALSLALVEKFMPNESRSINQTQVYESLIKKNLERMIRYNHQNGQTFDRNVDLTSFTGHYPLFLFAPICNEFLLGKIATAQDALK